MRSKISTLALILALVLVCGCETTKSKGGRVKYRVSTPMATMEGGKTTPPEATVGSSFLIENFEATGFAAELFAARLAGGIVELERLKKKEKTEKPPE